MGQNQSGFVVEIASPKQGRFQAIPQKDPDDEQSSEEVATPEWRITVNPAAEMFGTDRLRSLVDRLYHQQKLLTSGDARQVLTALQAIDPSADLLLPLLTVVSNATAYPSNQHLFSELRITERIVDMLMSKRAWARPCRVMLLQCVANMAVSKENQSIMRRSISHVVSRLASSDDMEVVVAMQALTNLSLYIDRTELLLFEPAIPHCLARLWVRGEVNLNAMRLLVNLVCCPDMVPYVLGAKSVSGLIRILDTDKDEILLRAVTFLLCMTTAVDALGLTYDRIAMHNSDPFRNPAHTIYHSVYGPKARVELEQRAGELAGHHNDDISYKAKRLLDTLSKVPPFPTPGSQLNRL